MRYSVLGPVEARVDRAELPVGGQQQRRLLALMLSSPGHVVTTERLVDCLWPDGLAPSGAARSVLTYVSRLRASLGAGSIATLREGYRLELNGSAVDADQFERLLAEAGVVEPGRAVELYDAALGLWRGAAYGEFGGEWWVFAEAERLNELRAVAMEERAEALLAVGRHHRVIPELEYLVSEHPLRERPVALLMRALFSGGRHVDALRAFQTFRSRLGAETGLEPSNDLVELERSLAAGRPLADIGNRARLLRGYAIHEVLGEGAYGRVFAATQPGTNREVAIKAIRPDLADRPEFVQRFEAEAQLVARLEHPHIVPLYDYWREPGGAYLVFRLLSGGTAYAAMVANGAFDLTRTSRLVEEVGAALLAAHSVGVVHCDIKPSNVLFDELGNSYLSDFGISVASTLDPQGDRTRAYAAPELNGSGDTIRSDIYSFGCMLWELLAGVSPGTMQRADRSRLPSLVDRVDASVQGIDAVIARATRDDPTSRFESIAELIVAWRDAVGRPEGVLSPVGATPGYSTSSPRRHAARALSTQVSSAINPYKGLRAFTEADELDFFGRDDVVVAVYEALTAHGFIAIVGPSGSGKSSLVLAGLVPLLRRNGARLVTMVPGDRPSVALRHALSHVATTKTVGTDEAELIEALVAEEAAPLVLVVDQFEECWTIADNNERERFLSTLAFAERHGIRCVVTVRADLYDRPLQHPVIGPYVAAGTFALQPLSASALEEAVVRPAARHGVEFDEGVATAIVAEISAQPAGLPLLQFSLAELYEQRVDQRLTAAALDELGGIGGAVGRRAETIYNDLGAELQTHARELFGRLIAPGQGTSDVRRPARLSELSEHTRLVADRFVAARLLVADRDVATREPAVEIAHEALLSNWPRLRDWLEADRRWLALLHHLAAASRSWLDSGRTDSELYQGSRLEAVIEELPEHGNQLSDDEQAFVDASRQARDAVRIRERRANRRLRTLLTATACLLILALIAGAIAFAQRHHANRSRRDAQLTTLATRSLAMRSSRRDVAALLAAEAYRLRPDDQSFSALFSTFTREPGFLGYHSYDAGDIEGAEVPNSSTAIVALIPTTLGADNPPLRSVDVTTGELGPPFEPVGPHDHGFAVVAVSRDGRVAAELTSEFIDGKYQPPVVAAFDVSTGRMIGRPIPAQTKDDITNGPIALNGDGTEVAVSGGTDGLARIFDVASGALLTSIQPPVDMEPSDRGGQLSVVSWAPDGRLYAGSSGPHLRVFDPSTFELEQDIPVPKYATGGLLKFSNDGTFVVARGVIGRNGSQQGSAARIELPSGTVTWTIGPDEYGNGQCDSLAFSVPEDRMWCGDYFGVIRGRSLSTGALDGTTIEHQRGWLSSLDVVVEDGARVLVSMGRNAASIGRWRVDGTGPISRRIKTSNDFAAFSPDGRWLLMFGPSDGPNGQMTIWDANDDRQLMVLPTNVVDAAWVDADHLGAVTDDGHLHVVEPATGTARDVAIQVDPDWSTIARVGTGKLAFGYFDGHADVFDVATGAKQLHLQVTNPFGTFQPAVHQLAASADGTRIYVAGSGVWAFDGSGRQVARTVETRYLSIALSDHAPIAAGSVDGTIALLDPADLSVIATLPGARGLPSTLRYSADGRLLLSRANDNTMSLYDVATRQRIGDPIDIGNSDADLRPDGQQVVVSGSEQGGILVWSLDPTVLTAAACDLAGRNLTRPEWAAYLSELESYHRTCPQFVEPPA